MKTTKTKTPSVISINEPITESQSIQVQEGSELEENSTGETENPSESLVVYIDRSINGNIFF
jgi:hypothetical protein